MIARLPFENPSLGALFEVLVQCLHQGGVESSQLEARWILQRYTGYDWAGIVGQPNVALTAGQLKAIERCLASRLEGIPLFRIFGEREFYGRSFLLSAETLDPRPESELLIEHALRHFDSSQSVRILDLGTGSGCLAVTLLAHWPYAKAIAVDLSYAALITARQNARQHGVEDRFVPLCGSWFDSLAAGGRSVFDLVISNPPYIRSSVIQTLQDGVKNHDPILALDGGKDGLQAYRLIFSSLKIYLEPAGRALLEIGYDQKENVMRLAENAGFSDVVCHPDYAGNPRVVDISCGDK